MYDTSFKVPSVIHTDRVKNRRLWVREHCLNLRKSENHYRVDSRQSRTHFQERKMNLRYISFKTTEPVGKIRREEKGDGNNSLMVFLVATCQDFRVGFYFYFENSIKTQYSAKKSYYSSQRMNKSEYWVNKMLQLQSGTLITRYYGRKIRSQRGDRHHIQASPFPSLNPALMLFSCHAPGVESSSVGRQQWSES